MYTGYNPNTSITKSSLSGLNETQFQSLQRQVDTYTKKLELEKRKYFTIQDQHKNVTQEYAKEKQKLNLIKKQKTKAESIILQAKVKNLDANLDKAVSVFDETIAYNNRLKGEIDMLRRQKKNYVEMQKILQQQLKKVDEETSEKMEQLNKKKKKTQDLKQQIAETKSKNEQERQSYINKFSALEKQYLGNSNDTSESKGKNNEILIINSGSKPQIIDTQPLLRFRLKRIIASNKQKIRLIQHYKKHMNSIEQAFNEIKSKSNIMDLDEITTTFIQSEEQNYSLYNYIDSLTQNIDRLQEENRRLEQNIQNKITQDELKREGINNSTNISLEKSDRRSLQIKYQSKDNKEETNDLINLVSKIKPTLQSALIDLASSPLSSIQKQSKKVEQYKLGLNINDRNIQQHLSELQRHIHLLQMAKHEAQPKTITQVKEGVTIYSKPIPSVNYDEVIKEKQKPQKVQREQGKFWEENKFRQYAMQFWQKRKGVIKNSNQQNSKQLVANQNYLESSHNNHQQIGGHNSKQLNSNVVNM